MYRKTVFGRRVRLVAVPTASALALLLTAGPSTATTLPGARSATVASSSQGPVVTPGAIDSIVASDTAINNRANASLSIALQDSHESCLQAALDDATYHGQLAAGARSLGTAFEQVPSQPFVPRETSYPATFSVLVADRSASQPTTTNFLTYVKTSPSARWKLSSSSEILGPTDAGVPVPQPATDRGGYATILDGGRTDGLQVAPDKVGARVAAALTAEAATGKLPSGITAEFGPNGVADPHAIAAAYAGLGTVTTTFGTAFPPAAAAGRPSADCPYPAYRLASGGALVTFALFSQLRVRIPSGEVVVQPPDRSALGALLPPGAYSSVTLTSGDMGVAVVPPAGSRSPIEVIGQASEGLSETGVTASGSSSSSASGGPADAASIARSVDPGLVDINTVLRYRGLQGAGTGMVLTPGGEVLTNNHVIEGATSISVTDVGNGRTYGAKVVGYDRTADVAVIQLLGAAGLRTVSLGDSTTVRVGQPVVGIGNAGGSGGTPSYAGGRVTALGRSITASDAADGTSEQLTGLIETNADIQAGDSGGPLVSTSGKVVGMDTAASSGFSFAQGGSSVQGYSIPIDTALGIARQITAGHASSTVHVGATAFLGVSVISSSANSGGLGQPVPHPSTPGAVIEFVFPGSPAARAGLAAGDTITSFDGHRVSSANSLTTLLESERSDARVPVGYLDPSGASRTVAVQLAAGPPQ